MRRGWVFVCLVIARSGFAQGLPSQDPFTRWVDHQLDDQNVMAPETALPIPSMPGGEPTVSVYRLRHNAPRKAWAAFDRSAKLAKAGNWQQAARELEKSVAIDPDFSQGHANLGASYLELNRPEQAAAEMRRAVQLDPATGTYHSNLALTLLILGRAQEAEPEARTAVSLDPANPRCQFIFGYALALRPETRSRALAHLIYAAREFSVAHRVLAQVYQLSGDENQADAEWKLYEISVTAGQSKGKGAVADKNYELDTASRIQ
jgi:tetratricopeptide (TPR) repeat protein